MARIELTSEEQVNSLVPTYAEADKSGRYTTLGSKDGLAYDGRNGYDGASQVVVDGWSKSVTTGSHIDGAILNVRRITGTGAFLTCQELNGKKFATREEADEAAYNAGITEYMFYTGPRFDSLVAS